MTNCEPTASAVRWNTFSPVFSKMRKSWPVLLRLYPDRQRHRVKPGPRRVGIEVRPAVRVQLGSAGVRSVDRRVVADVLRDGEVWSLVRVVVVAEPGAESPVHLRARHQIQVGREDARLGLGRGSRQRQLRQRGIDRERLKRLVVLPGSKREEPGELRAVRELGEAADAHRLRRVRRPQRGPPAPGSAG